MLLSLGITHTFSFLIYPIALLILLYLVLIVLYRPYKSCFSNLSVILNECLTLLAVSLALTNKFFTIGSDTEAFILFILQGLIILCLVFSLIRVFLHIRGLCRKKEGKEGERGEEGEEGRGERRDAPRKKRELTDVDLSLNRAIKEEKKKINPYTAVLPQHSYPLKSRSSRNPRSTRRQELDRIEESEKEGDDPLLGEIKDRLRNDFHRKKRRAL